MRKANLWKEVDCGDHNAVLRAVEVHVGSVVAGVEQSSDRSLKVYFVLLSIVRTFSRRSPVSTKAIGKVPTAMTMHPEISGLLRVTE